MLVLAVEEEAAHLDRSMPVLLTGMGKVNAASALAAVLGRGSLPSVVVNLGTAGALRDGLRGTHEVSRAIQHDLHTAFLYLLTGQTYGAPLQVCDSGPVLATGDSFVSDKAAREQLAVHADLVDMEGYALAAVARKLDVPIRLVKHVSDEAGEDAARTWRESVDDCAKALSAWARDNLR